jgi:hypothetical protein
MHGEIHWKAVFDANLRKGTTKTPINSTQLGQSTTGGAILVQPKACHTKAVGNDGGQGAADPRGGWPPAGFAHPLLCLAVAGLYAEAMQLSPHANNSSKHSCPPYTNRGVERESFIFA